MGWHAITIWNIHDAGLFLYWLRRVKYIEQLGASVVLCFSVHHEIRDIESTIRRSEADACVTHARDTSCSASAVAVADAPRRNLLKGRVCREETAQPRGLI